jgi:crossover junction endodeoxyribonuclease RusA
MIVLPFPPSVNRLWRQFKGRTILSAEGRKYRKAVADSLYVAKYQHGDVMATWGCPDAFSVHIKAFMPDARRRDLDNLLKASLDALTHTGLWEDDSQIKRLTIEHCGIDRDNPRLEVGVSTL